MGGMHGFGPVVVEQDEPVFHAAWEGTVRAMWEATLNRYYNVDEFRGAIERMRPDAYLRASYYERWLHAVETLLLEKGVITPAELDARHADRPAPPPAGAPPPAPRLAARFRPGDRVRTRVVHPAGHTRLPRYARGKRGVIRTVNGPFGLPDSKARGRSDDWQACYAVEFEARELWGEDARGEDRVCVDLWESYLIPEAAP